MRRYPARRIVQTLAGCVAGVGLGMSAGAPGSARADRPTDDELMTMAQTTLASQIEAGLPDEPVPEWLARTVGDDAVWRWGLNDCGEQTGVPEIDRERDLPICADLEITDGVRTVFVYFLLGFEQSGLAESRSLYYAGVSDPATHESFESLASLEAHLRQPRAQP